MRDLVHSRLVREVRGDASSWRRAARASSPLRLTHLFSLSAQFHSNSNSSAVIPAIGVQWSSDERCFLESMKYDVIAEGLSGEDKLRDEASISYCEHGWIRPTCTCHED